MMCIDDNGFFCCSETGELINIEKEDSGYIPRLLDFKHKVTNVSCGKEHVLLTAQGNIYSYGYGR